MSTIEITLATLARADYELLGWKREPCPPSLPGGVIFRRPGHNSLMVIAKVVTTATRVWLHLTVEMRHRLPTWRELRAVKEGFIGPNRHAFNHMPRIDGQVLTSSNCFELWAVVEGEDPFEEIFGKDPLRTELPPGVVVDSEGG